jgi:excisionase family DNA binding protein
MSGTGLERFYTTREVADMLRVNTATVLRAAGRGELHSVRVGHQRRYSEAAVREWLELLASPSNGRSAA